MLGRAVEWDYIRASPAGDVKQQSEGRKLPRPYRDDEVKALLDALDDDTRDVARLYLETALRVGELTKLLWADVDLAGATLMVRAPKNGRDRRVPSLSSEALRVLSDRRRQWQAEQSDGHADLRVYGHRADVHEAVRAAWHVLLAERREVQRPVHSFRDTAITRRAAAVPLPVVQELAGHATLEMTRRYTEVSPGAMREAVTKVFG